MGVLASRVVVVTGAGRGLGREHARLLASEGARLVVNDLGCAADGSGADPAVIEALADELRGAGAEVASTADDVATMEGARRLLDAALDAYGEVHALVNNAGILRDRMLVNMSEDEWDDVIRGQLRGTFGPTRVFAAHWRDRSRSGDTPGAAIVNVSSTSGLIGQAGQTNYGAAKAGIAALTVILAEEVRRYGIRVNGIVPVARTRMTEHVPGVAELIAAPADPDAFDVYHPGNVSPVVGWLVSAGCPVTGQLYYAKGGEIRRMLGWRYETLLDREARWTVAELDKALAVEGG
jgi:NAD(P)-dependent dehydrogenase (short-subunit alcohol dehydrogenase family)